MSSTDRNADGSYTRHVFEQPVHYRGSDGSWVPIKSDMVPSLATGYAWRNEANAFTTRFASQVKDRFVQLEVSGRKYDMSVDSLAAAATKRSGEVTYHDPVRGVDATYAPLPDGLKETLVLRNAGAPDHFSFRIDAPTGATLRTKQLPDSSWEVFDGPAVEPTFVLEAPWARELRADGVTSPEADRHATIDLRVVGSTLQGILTIDHAWLSDPARQFPVAVDPTLSVQPDAEDVSVIGNCSTCTVFTDQRVWIGSSDTSTYRAALKFDIGELPANASITSANLKLYFEGLCISAQQSCASNSYPIRAHRITGNWSTASTTSQVTFDSTILSTTTLPAGAPPQQLSWPVTSAVQAWAAGTQPNYGIMLKRDVEQTKKSGPVLPGKRFTTDPGIRPTLDITYTGDAVTLLPVDTVHSNGADLRWTPFASATGATFQRYEVHRNPGTGTFTPNASTLLATITDPTVTSFRDTTAKPSADFAYRIVAGTSATTWASNTRAVTTPADGQAVKTLQPGAADGKATFGYYYVPFVNCANYGVGDYVDVGGAPSPTNGALRAFLGFDVRDIPPGSTIGSATMSLVQAAAPAVTTTYRAYRLTKAWDEGTGDTEVGTCTKDGATWYDANGAEQWGTAGGDFNPTPAGSITKAANAPVTRDDYDVAPIVSAWVNGTAPNLGIMLKADDESTGANHAIRYWSDDFTFPSSRPKLTVTYTDNSHAQGPTASLAAPAAGVTVSGSSVTLAASASDDRRIDQVDFLVDGNVVATRTTAPWTTTWNSTSVGNGSHNLAVRATDDAGNVTTAPNVAVTVANSAPPAVAITSPAGGATVSGSVNVTTNPSDDIAVTKVELYADDLLVGAATASPWTISWDTLSATTPAFDGTHVLTARAYDGDGQATTSATVTVTTANRPATDRATFAPSDLPAVLTYDPSSQAQATTPVDLGVTNDATTAWAAGAMQARYRWISLDPTIAPVEGPDIAMGALGAGATATIRLDIAPPTLPAGDERASFVLRFDLRDAASGQLLASVGNAPSDRRCDVSKPLPIGLGLERYYHYEGVDAGGGMESLVNLGSGNSILRFSPSSSPGRGLSTLVDLTYNALENHSDSPMGNNWSLSMSSLTRLGARLDIHPNHADDLGSNANRSITFVDGDGTSHTFIGALNGSTVYWKEPAGVHLYLRRYSTTDNTKAWALTRPDRVTFFYDVDGYPTSVTDANGNTIKFTLSTVAPGDDPGGPSKRISAVTDAAGNDPSPAPNRTYTVTYWAKADKVKSHVRGKVRRITDHNGSAIDFDYYDDGNLLRITERGGTKADGSYLADRSWVFTYTNSPGNGPAISDPNLRVNPDPHTPSESTRIYSVRDPRGAETRFGYLGSGNGNDRWKLASRTTRDTQTTTFAYDAVNRTTTVTKPMSRVSTYTFDTSGKVTSILNPLNQTATVAWTADFEPQRITEPTGKYSEFAYDDNGYLTDQWDQLRNHTQLAYTAIAVDANDVTGNWKPGRTIAHISQLATKTEPRGTATSTPTNDFQWSFSHDGNGNLTKVTDPAAQDTNSTYNPDGTLATVTDANTHTTTYAAYDANGQVTRMVDAASSTIRFTYDDDGNLLTVQDPRHQDDAGTDVASYLSRFFYDSFGRLGAQSAPKSTSFDRGTLIWTGVDYDANDNLLSSTQPYFATTQTGAGPKTTTVYDTMDRPTLVTGPDTTVDPLGQRISSSYDAAGRLISQTLPKGMLTAGIAQDYVTDIAYDALDRAVRQTRYLTDAAGTVTSTLYAHSCYDLAGNLVSTTSPRANQSTVDCASTTTPNTNRTTFDDAHRPISTTDPLGHLSSVSYDEDNNVVTSTDANAAVTTMTYDALDRPVKSQEPLTTGSSPRLLTTLIDYDPVGNRTRVISPRGWDTSADHQTFTNYVTGYHYDNLNRLVRTDLPTDGSTTAAFEHRWYDRNGNLTAVSQPVTTSNPAAVTSKSKSTYTYFDPGWVRTSTPQCFTDNCLAAGGAPPGPVNPTMHFDYTAEGWQSTRTPEVKGGTTLDLSRQEIWRYFADGKLRSRAGRDGQESVYSYDANDNPVNATTAGGVLDPSEKAMDVTSSYDSLDRLAKTRTHKAGDTTWRATTYTYDLDGNITDRVDDATEDSGGTVTTPGRDNQFTLDANGWVTRQLDLGLSAGAADDQRISHTWAPTGWETSKLVEANNGSGTWLQRQKTDTTYLANGLPSDVTTHSNASTVLEHHVLGYEDAGVFQNGNTVTDAFTRAAAGGSPPCVSSACTSSYRYDARDRLTRTDDGHGTVTTDVLDAASNLVSETAVGSQPSSSSYTYNAGNQIASATVNGAQQLYFYDADGNVQCVTRNDAGVTQADCTPTTSTSSGAKASVLAAYTYDYLDRLKTSKLYTSDGTTSTFTSSTQTAYDALDRPTQNDEKQGSTPTQLLFAYVGLSNAVTNETHKNGSGATTDTKTFSYDYAGTRLSLTDTPTGGSASTLTYGYDANASVSLLVNAAGAAQATYGYTPYGATDATMTKGDVSATDPLNPYRFQAKRYDPGSGTVDMGARSFSPQTGRFLQQDQYHDSLGDLALATDPLTNNRYAFTAGNPVNFVEVDGHYACLDNSSSCQSPVRHDNTVSDRSVQTARRVTRQAVVSRQKAQIAALAKAAATAGFGRGPCPPGQELLSTPPAGYQGAHQEGHQCQTPSSGSTIGTGVVFGILGAAFGMALCGGFDVCSDALMDAGEAPVAEEVGAAAETGTGTVWDSISATQSVYEGTELPRSFVMNVGEGENVWVAPNASEHILERIGNVSEDLQPIQTQNMLSSLRSAVGAANEQGISLGKMTRIGGWELMFDAPRAGELYPVLYHALYLG